MLDPRDDAYLAYCINEVVYYVGTAIEAELDKIGETTDSKTRSIEQSRLRRLHKLIDEPGKEAKAQFMDPAMMV